MFLVAVDERKHKNEETHHTIVSILTIHAIPLCIFNALQLLHKPYDCDTVVTVYPLIAREDFRTQVITNSNVFQT